MDNSAYQAPVANLDNDKDAVEQDFRYSNWQGRMGRLKYLQLSFFVPTIVFFGYLFLFFLLLYFLDGANEYKVLSAVEDYILWGVSLILIVSFANWIWLSIQRAHDIGASGWLALLVFIPLLHFVLFLIPGEEEKNKFGFPPKENTILVKITGWLGLVGVALYYLLLWILSYAL